MAINDAAKNVMLDALAAAAVFVSAHDADPSTTGANELSSSPYAREAITWNAAASGTLDSLSQPMILVAGGDTVAYIGLWSAKTSGVFYGSADVTDETFTGDGSYTVTDFDISIT